MTQKLVSVMMPAYNAEGYIRQAIDSALAQRYTHWELAIVDDGSTDGTGAVIASFADERIRMMRQANAGEAAARNAALEMMQGEYIAFLDADDAWLPDHLEQAVRCLEANPGLDGVYTDGQYIDEQGRQLGALSSRRRGPFSGDIFEQMIRASDVFGAPLCVVIRRGPVVAQGLKFDPEIVIGPDWEFLARYSQTGRFAPIASQTCLYRVHQSNISLRTNAQKRLLHLARCRENMVKMERFNDCTEETRAFVFYDLLVNLLTGQMGRQDAVLQWEEFQALPGKERARLLRLMASKTLLQEGQGPAVGRWLGLSRQADGSDTRAAALLALYILSPAACRALLGLRASRQSQAAGSSPFAGLAGR